jgi:microcystin-dependent protein
MSNPYVGEIRLFAGNFAPQGWAFCDGQTLLIADNTTLFQLIGTTYGGDGQSTFHLPDLRGRVPIHAGTDVASGMSYVQGEFAGAEAVVVTLNQLPAHSHVPACSAQPGDALSPTGAVWAAASVALYSPNAPDANLRAGLVAPAGTSQPHDNMAPYLAVSFIISLFGVFPSPT